MKKMLVFALLLVVASASVVFSQNVDNETIVNAEKMRDEGRKLYKSGQFDASIVKYDESLIINETATTHYLKGISQLKLSKKQDAIQSFDKAIILDPNLKGAYSAKGSSLLSLKKYDLAIESYNMYLEKSTDKKKNSKIKGKIATAYTKLANDAKRDGKHRKAINYLNKAVDNYKFDSAYLTLAEIYIELANYNEALSAADNAINNRKKTPKGAGYYYKGLAFKGLENKEKAIESFKVSIKDKSYKALSEYELKQLK